MAQILIRLKTNRDYLGKLYLYDKNNHLISSYFAFGRADKGKAASMGNAGAAPTKKFGHTPTGQYGTNNSIIASGAGTSYNADSYGPHGIIFLNPTGGDALTAKNNGRTGLAIHGGKPGNGNALRPTNGCVRLSNPDMDTLVNQVRFLFMQGDAIQQINVMEEDIPDNVLGDLVAQSNDPDPFAIV